MTREEREDALNCFKNKLENEVFGAKYNKLALEALEQASILDKIRAEINTMPCAITSMKEVYVNRDKVINILDKYKAEFEAKDKVSQG